MNIADAASKVNPFMDGYKDAAFLGQYSGRHFGDPWRMT
jgi:hypothetical protein